VVGWLPHTAGEASQDGAVWRVIYTFSHEASSPIDEASEASGGGKGDAGGRAGLAVEETFEEALPEGAAREAVLCHLEMHANPGPGLPLGWRRRRNETKAGGFHFVYQVL